MISFKQITLFTVVTFVCFSFSAIHKLNAQSNTTIIPTISLLLNDDAPSLTDRSNVQCSLTLESFSPEVGSDIPVSSEFSATYSYEISQRPLDVEVQILAFLLGSPEGESASGITLSSSPDNILVNINEGDETISDQITLTSINTGVNGMQELQDLTATCSFFTIFDEEDEQNNPGPSLGSRIQFSTQGISGSTQRVDWFLGTRPPP